MTFTRASPVALVLACTCATAFAGQTPSPPPFTRPSVTAVRIDTAEAPVIDADLSDPAWEKAAVIDRFRQRSPNPSEPATERTVVRILYDENNLYVAFYNYDSAPDQIVVRNMQRDGQVYTSDSAMIYLDPGRTRRNAYNFEIGASGGRTDQLELNNTEELREWNTIFDARARIVADGWVAEFAIPFKSLSYEATETTWGFEVARRIFHKNERVHWAGFNPALDFTDVSQTGDLVGIENVGQGIGLDVQIHGAPRLRRDWQLGGGGDGVSLTAGGNAFYKVTPALTNTLTINPDFSDAPLDIRQVNTTRFSLFTPETRDFFLQDVAAFEFGGRSYGRNSQDRVSNNGRPFFSRNIGLVQGRQVSLPVGNKLSGQVAGFDVGAFSVLTDRTPGGEEGQVLSVARATRPILAESKFGLVVTHGDPTGLTRNTVAGADFQYRNSNLFGNKVLQADLLYMKSFSSAAGNDDSSAVSLNFPNEPWSGDFLFKQIGAAFTPALGFVNRAAMRQYAGTVAHLTRYRRSSLNTLEFGTNFEFVTDLNNLLESRANDVLVRVRSRIGDQVTVRVVNTYENVPAPFFLPRTVPVLAGTYEWTNLNVGVRTFNGRLFTLQADVTCCRFYDGDAVASRVNLIVRPAVHFEINVGHEANAIDLPTGRVDIHLATTDAVVNFTPDLQVALQAQYDNISEHFALSARYRWEYRPGNELFIGLGQSALITNRGFIGQVTQATVRLGHTLRF
ncbi:MAG: carbohydrate binding family 9 domain-containing protein [Acidobacteria bacterium]|nr:carbohydrate binding family 9 domain-containing protein [Acidobacteriota bacterium]